MEALGLTTRDVFLVHDEITGQTWRWGQHAFVRLTRTTRPRLTLIRYGDPAAGPDRSAGRPAGDGSGPRRRTRAEPR